jgi:hypothetical protein
MRTEERWWAHSGGHRLEHMLEIISRLICVSGTTKNTSLIKMCLKWVSVLNWSGGIGAEGPTQNISFRWNQREPLVYCTKCTETQSHYIVKARYALLPYIYAGFSYGQTSNRLQGDIFRRQCSSHCVNILSQLIPNKAAFHSLNSPTNPSLLGSLRIWT